MHVCAGQDRAFRVFSAIQDQQSREMSQGKLASKAKRMRVTQEDLKLPRVIAMDACQVSLSGMLVRDFKKPSQLHSFVNICMLPAAAHVRPHLSSG